MKIQNLFRGIVNLRMSTVVIGCLGTIGSVAMFVSSLAFIIEPLWYAKATNVLKEKEAENLRMFGCSNPIQSESDFYFFGLHVIIGMLLTYRNLMLIYGAFHEKLILVRTWIISTFMISVSLGLLGFLSMSEMHKRGSRDLEPTIALYVGGAFINVTVMSIVGLFYWEIRSKTSLHETKEALIDASSDVDKVVIEIAMEVPKSGYI